MIAAGFTGIIIGLIVGPIIFWLIDRYYYSNEL